MIRRFALFVAAFTVAAYSSLALANDFSPIDQSIWKNDITIPAGNVTDVNFMGDLAAMKVNDDRFVIEASSKCMNDDPHNQSSNENSSCLGVGHVWVTVNAAEGHAYCTMASTCSAEDSCSIELSTQPDHHDRLLVNTNCSGLESGYLTQDNVFRYTLAIAHHEHPDGGTCRDVDGCKMPRRAEMFH